MINDIIIIIIVNMLFNKDDFFNNYGNIFNYKNNYINNYHMGVQHLHNVKVKINKYVHHVYDLFQVYALL